MRHRIDTWTMRWTQNWPAWLKGLCQGHHNQARQGPHSGELWGSMIFNIFINDLADGTECSFSSFTHNRKLWAFQTPEGCDDTQKCLKEVQEWADSSPMQVKGKCKVLCLWRNNPMKENGLKTNQPETSFAEENLKLKQTEHHPGRCTCEGHQHLGSTRTAVPALWHWWSFLSCKL